MKTTLSVVCAVFGWQGGTLADVQRRMAIASPQEMDRVCTALSADIRNISDPRNAMWFMEHRREANELHVRAAVR